MNAPVLADLARDLLETAPGLEVVTSYVELPPNFQLPVHTHPGEEFAYVIEGSIRYWEQGRDEIEIAAGTTGKVPVETVHTVRTTDEGAKLLVFRVHQVGKPERTLVDVTTTA
jgi:quercetin dioxygenase-like cupin family protein